MRSTWLDQGLILLFTGSFMVFVNLHLAFIIMPLYVLELGGGDWTAAWYNTLLAGAAVLFRLFFASWVDRFGRKFSLLVSGSALVTAPLFILLAGSPAYLSFIRVFQALGLALYPLAANTLIADLSPVARRGTVLGLQRLIIITALITGPPVAVLIVEQYGFQTLFWLLTILGLAGMAPLLAIREPVRAGTGTPVLNGFQFVLASRPLRVLISSTAACGLAYGVLLTFLPLYAVRVGIDNFGLYFTVFAFSGLVSGVVAGRLSDAFGRRKVLVPSLALFGMGILYLGLPAPGAVMMVSAVVAGIGYSASLTLLVAWVVDAAGRKLRAASLGLFENGIDVGITAGSFAFGSVVALLGFGFAFSTAGALLLIFAVLIATLDRGPVSQIR